MTFRWPFMTRSSHEEVISTLRTAMQSRIAATEQFLSDEKDRTNALTAQLVGMQKEGFRIVHPAPVRQPVNPLPSDDAINERAGRSPTLRRHLILWRNQQRAAGVEELTLAEAITNWRDPDEDSA